MGLPLGQALLHLGLVVSAELEQSVPEGSTGPRLCEEGLVQRW